MNLGAPQAGALRDQSQPTTLKTTQRRLSVRGNVGREIEEKANKKKQKKQNEAFDERASNIKEEALENLFITLSNQRRRSLKSLFLLALHII